MKLARVAAAFFALLISAVAANAQQSLTCFVSTSYAIAQDTSAGSQVWKYATGVLIANSDAGYQSWLSAQSGCAIPGAQIISAGDNGSGKVRFLVGTTSKMATGQVLEVFGTGSYDGPQSITVVDINHVDLTSVLYLGSSVTGAFYGPLVEPTMAQLLADIDGANKANCISGGENIISGTSSVTLTTPVKTIQRVTFTGAASFVQMPQANLFGSIPIGCRIKFKNAGGNTFNLNDSSGSVIISNFTTASAADVWVFANDTVPGSYAWNYFGGIQCPTHQWVTTYGPAQNPPNCTQPASTDLSDLGAWSTFTPTITCNAGAVGAYSVQVGRSKTLGKTINVAITVQAAAGTCVGPLTIAGFPAAFVNVANDNQILTGLDISTGVPLACEGIVNGTTCSVFGTVAVVSNALSFSGAYESN